MGEERIMNNRPALAALRTTFSRLGTRGRIRDRRLWRDASDNDGILELVYLNFGASIDTAIMEASGPSLPGDTAIGDGMVLDWLGNAVKWIIENQDAILAFVKAIIEIFAGFGI